MTYDVELYQEQLEFIESEEIYTCFSAGYGSGKSFALTLKTILFKLKYPKVRVAYYLPSFPLIRDIAFIAFPEMLDNMGVPYKLNKSSAEIHIPGYGSILFRSMMIPENIVGYSVGHSFIDECDILPQDKMQVAFEKILSRNRQPLPDKKPNKISVASTPEGFRWMWKQFVDNPIKSSNLIYASSYSNKFLPDGYIDSLLNQYTPELVEAYVNGKFVNLFSGTVYEYFKRDIHHRDIDTTSIQAKRKHLHVGVDFNVGYCSMVFCTIEGEVVEVIHEHGAHDTFGIIQYLKGNFKDRIITIYPDSSGKNSSSNASRSNIQLIEDAGYICDYPGKNPFIEDRVSVANNLFSKNRIYIDTNKCPKLTGALERQAWVDGKPEKSGEAGSDDDLNDSFTYFIHRKFNPNQGGKVVQRRFG